MSPSQIKTMVQRALAGVRWAFLGVIGQIKRTTPTQLASVDGLAGEALSGVELMQHFGFTSTPPAGTHAIVLPLGGRTSASVIVATEAAAFRLVLDEAGEAALYNADGDYVWLKRNGHIKLKASVKVEIETPEAEITGNLAVGGNIGAVGSITDLVTAGGKSMGQMREIFNTHVHAENDEGGPTATPNTEM